MDASVFPSGNEEIMQRAIQIAADQATQEAARAAAAAAYAAAAEGVLPTMLRRTHSPSEVARLFTLESPQKRSEEEPPPKKRRTAQTRQPEGKARSPQRRERQPPALIRRVASRDGGPTPRTPPLPVTINAAFDPSLTRHAAPLSLSIRELKTVYDSMAILARDAEDRRAFATLRVCETINGVSLSFHRRHPSKNTRGDFFVPLKSLPSWTALAAIRFSSDAPTPDHAVLLHRRGSRGIPLQEVFTSGVIRGQSFPSWLVGVLGLPAPAKAINFGGGQGLMRARFLAARQTGWAPAEGDDVSEVAMRVAGLRSFHVVLDGVKRPQKKKLRLRGQPPTAPPASTPAEGLE